MNCRRCTYLGAYKDAGKDGGIFYCCNGLNDLKALVDKGMEDFAIAGCTDFGAYEELL